MKIAIQSIHFTADQKLLEYVEAKVEKLGKYFEKIMSVEVKLKLENTGQVRDKIVEIIAHVPRERLMSKGNSKAFESATDEAVDLMQRQIKKYKTKLVSKKRAQNPD